MSNRSKIKRPGSSRRVHRESVFERSPEGRRSTEWLAGMRGLDATAPLPPVVNLGTCAPAAPTQRAASMRPVPASAVATSAPVSVAAPTVQLPVHLYDEDRVHTQAAPLVPGVQEAADGLAAENDVRMAALLARSRSLGESWGGAMSAFERGWEGVLVMLRQVVVTHRRRARIRPLVQRLGHLVASGDVDQATAARIMSMRSRYLDEDAPSQHLPRLTPELLAELDAQAVAGLAVKA